ncbi:MAG: dipeptidyl aminopeptidase [Rhodospirillaceae bacterium]|nr:dipeptidyl aminopeptidase [Rhodospirillaceae bacterium]|tara:strand:+ start:19645 stop:20910 length:1266 start_codon:yes stop_codon:yes gene_type:complete
MPKITERRRDNQQWMLDWIIKTTGRVQNFAYDNRVVPKEVKSYAQIHRLADKHGRHVVSIAEAAEKAGHLDTAAELFWAASEHYREAQHTIFEDDNPEKIYLHGMLLECFDKVMQYAKHPIERVEIPFEGNYIQGVLHMLPGRPKAPTVIFCPGMDMTKEAFIDALNHPFVNRGMNCLHLDGPGQGTSNIRKIRVTLDNYERAGSAAIDYLSDREEVDEDQIVVSGFSMGSYWGMRLAAIDKRVKAVATAAACYGPKDAIFEQASPRFKQVFMYMAGIHDEDEFDEFAAQMILDDLASDVTCPALQVTGEYDPLAPLETVLPIYEKVSGPKELWVIENDFHNPRNRPNFGGIDFFGFLADWLNDALAGKYEAGHKREILVPEHGEKGPYVEQIEGGFSLPERVGKKAGLNDVQLGPAGVKS